MKQVTIVINNLNDGKFLPGLVDSIRAQDCQDFDLVGLDAGSTDDSLDVYARHGVPVVDCRNLNQAASVNKVVGELTTPFFSWINPDDRYLPNFVSSHLAAFKPCVGVVVSDLLIERAGGARAARKARGIMASMEDGQNYVFHPTTMIRRATWEAAGRFDESYVYAFDFEFWTRCAALGVGFAHIPEPTAVFCPRVDSLSGTCSEQVRKEIYRIQVARGLPTDTRYAP